MPSPDQSTSPSVPGIPAPPTGAGAVDLATTSTDPQELRELLDRARERLAFYESFDRIIGENIRRSGELMVETVTLREQAQALAARSARERAEFEATRQADQDRYRALIQHALDEAASVRPMIDAMVERLQGVLQEIGSGADDQGPGAKAATPESVSLPPISEVVPATPSNEMLAPEIEAMAPAVTPDGDQSGNEDAMEADSTEESTNAPPTEEPAVATTDTVQAEDAPAPEPDATADDQDGFEPEAEAGAHIEIQGEPAASVPMEPRNIDVLAHGVPSARVAISLKKMLLDLDVVTSVEMREFAAGELRLTVQATDALPDTQLAGWLADNSGELTSSSSTVTELTFRER